MASVAFGSNVRRWFLLIALALPLTATAMSESSCLYLAEFAGATAKDRESGGSMVDAKLDAYSKDDKVRQVKWNIISFVFVMQLAPDAAMKQVYLKCKANEYD